MLLGFLLRFFRRFGISMQTEEEEQGEVVAVTM